MKGRLTVFIKQTDMADGRRMTELIMKVNGKQDVDMVWGFSIAPRKSLRVGEWKNDRYKGERLVYTSERIYGIDISKYQHGKGRKKYPINWDLSAHHASGQTE